MGTNADVQLVTGLAPLASPLAPVSKEDVFTPDQWAVLFALLEVFVPAIVSPTSKADGLRPDNYEEIVKEIQLYAPPDCTRADVEAYLAESLIDVPDVKEGLRRRFLQAVPRDARAGLSSVLSALNTTAGSLLLTGSTTPIHKQAIASRSVIVRKWATSYIPTLRKLHNTFAGLSKQYYVHQSTTWPKVIGYKGHYADVAKREKTYPFVFKDFSATNSATTIETDVVIVGSGPGAGATTNRLANAGLKCIVVDKGHHFSSDHFPMKHSDAQEHLYENFGAVMSDDGSLATAAASTFGGGGTVNWLASLQPPSFVRQQWADEEGLRQFTGQAYQESLDYVCDKMGAARSNDHEALGKIKHNYANKYLLEGARRVGLDVKVAPQNTGGKVHDCGHCHLGCPTCTKQGPANLWFPEAAEKGTEFIVGFWAEKILWADDGKTAVGVKGQWTSTDRQITKDVTIRAKKVIVASGTFQSPLLLKRSGLTNPWIGKNFHVHPVWYCFATVAERIDPWQGGGLLTSVVTSLRHGTGDGHGPVIEICMGLPTQTGLPIPNMDAAQHKVDIAKLGHTVALFSMVRDKDAGEIYADKNDPKMAHMKYSTSQRDKEQLLIGQVAAAKVAYAMGALEINVCHPDVHTFVRSKTASQEINDQAFDLWLGDVKSKGITANSEPLMLHSAHQFGTCKMSGRQERGVVDGKGRVWGCQNLWVADSSVLPTATGVNPMVSTMGTADFIARGIEEEWRAETKA